MDTVEDTIGVLIRTKLEPQSPDGGPEEEFVGDGEYPLRQADRGWTGAQYRSAKISFVPPAPPPPPCTRGARRPAARRAVLSFGPRGTTDELAARDARQATPPRTPSWRTAHKKKLPSTATLFDDAMIPRQGPDFGGGFVVRLALIASLKADPTRNTC